MLGLGLGFRFDSGLLTCPNIHMAVGILNGRIGCSSMASAQYLRGPRQSLPISLALLQETWGQKWLSPLVFRVRVRVRVR